MNLLCLFLPFNHYRRYFATASAQVILIVNTVGGSPNYLYQFNTQITPSATSGLLNIGAGTYSVTTSDTHGCTTFNQIRVEEPPLLTLAFSDIRNAGCYGTVGGYIQAVSAGGTGNANFFNYDWSIPSANISTLSGILAGVYTTTVTDANGCTHNHFRQLLLRSRHRASTPHIYMNRFATVTKTAQ